MGIPFVSYTISILNKQPTSTMKYIATWSSCCLVVHSTGKIYHFVTNASFQYTGACNTYTWAATSLSLVNVLNGRSCCSITLDLKSQPANGLNRWRLWSLARQIKVSIKKPSTSCFTEAAFRLFSLFECLHWNYRSSDTTSPNVYVKLWPRSTCMHNSMLARSCSEFLDGRRCYMIIWHIMVWVHIGLCDLLKNF